MNQIRQSTSKVTPRPAGRRDAALTRENLLQAAMEEFCERGLGGARTANIAARAGCNIRLLYHHFGNKDGIYLAALERVYADLRRAENDLDLLSLAPAAGITRLVEFTFDYLRTHQEFIKMVQTENIQQGRYLRRSKAVPEEALPLVDAIATLLRRGEETGVFRSGIDPVQFYFSILSLSFIHLSSRYTLSITFGQDLADPDWLDLRRQHVIDLVMASVRP